MHNNIARLVEHHWCYLSRLSRQTNVYSTCD